MSTDFRSLLSSFQSATGDTPTPTALEGGQKKKKSLKELTTSLYQRSQLRLSVKAIQKSACQHVLTNDAKPIHLAICLCVVDSVTHEQVWKEWMQEKTELISAELHVHAKTPEKIRNTWARSKLIGITHRPNWNDVRVVQAMLSLVEAALKDPKTTHIVFGTESCLPICPLSEIKISFGKSYVAYYGKDQATRFDERDVWDALSQHIPLDAIHKALPGWCTLARDHAQQILDLPKNELDGRNLWNAFEPCWAPEEAYFPTALALLGLLPETESQSLTYVEWNERARKPEDKAHPKDWDAELSPELISFLRREHGAIILRKVKYPVHQSQWKQMMLDGARKRPGEPKDELISSKRSRV